MVCALIVMASYYLGVSRYASSGRGAHDTRTNCYGFCKLLLALVNHTSFVYQSLALALYFASRGKGQIRQSLNATPIPYTSKARVLLNGLGSDELLGGYGRHRSVYKTGSWQAVVSEVSLASIDI